MPGGKMKSRKSLTLKSKGKIIYSIKVNDDVLWEGENVHEVFPTLKETYKRRNLSIYWEVKKGQEIAE